MNVSGFSQNLVCALILRRSGLELLLGKFCLFLIELAASNKSDFSFPEDNLSKYQWIFNKLGVCIDIVEICLGLLMGKFHQFLTEICL